MRHTAALVVVLATLVAGPRLVRGQAPVIGTEVFVTLDYGAGFSDCDIDSLVLESLDGETYVFEYNTQVPLGDFETLLGGAVFAEGCYMYESLFVDFALDSLGGSQHHHPIPTGGNPGGYTYIHDPMCTRIWRVDGEPFRIASIDYRNVGSGFRLGTTPTPSDWTLHATTTGDPNWNTLVVPILAAAATGGAAEDVLTVNGSGGGDLRRVDAAVGTPLTLALGQPSATTTPAQFVVFGRITPPDASGIISVPQVAGELCFVPCEIGGDGFVVASTVGAGVCSLVAGALPAPWSWTDGAGLPVPGQVTLQGLIEIAPGVAATTNAVVLRIL